MAFPCHCKSMLISHNWLTRQMFKCLSIWNIDRTEMGILSSALCSAPRLKSWGSLDETFVYFAAGKSFSQDNKALYFGWTPYIGRTRLPSHCSKICLNVHSSPWKVLQLVPLCEISSLLRNHNINMSNSKGGTPHATTGELWGKGLFCVINSWGYFSHVKMMTHMKWSRTLSWVGDHFVVGSVPKGPGSLVPSPSTCTFH